MAFSVKLTDVERLAIYQKALDDINVRLYTSLLGSAIDPETWVETNTTGIPEIDQMVNHRMMLRERISNLESN